MPAKSSSKDYATLFLARAILEDDVAMARAALDAGGSLSGKWIDGQTSLRDLPVKLQSKKVAAFLADRLNPAKTRSLPVYDPRSQGPEQEKYWSREFVLFAARRGYRFDGRTVLQRGAPGSQMPPFTSVRSAVSKIATNWDLAKQVSTRDGRGEDGGSSFWNIEFDARWNRDKRIAGFQLWFRVDADGWDLFEAYRDGNGLVRHEEPDANDPMLDRQKIWEGNAIMERLLDVRFTFDELVSAVGKGANPFFKWNGKPLDELLNDSPEIAAFLARMRELCAPEIGFHRRLAPHLTKSSLRTLAAASELEASTPPAQAKRKTLAEGRGGSL